MISKTGDELDHIDITEMHARLACGELSSIEFTQRCVDRIGKIDPELNAVSAIDHTALVQAARSDQRHRHGADLGALDGIPVLIEDDIDTARLRAAGAVVLGRTAVGGPTHNPYRRDHRPWGSSAGSAVAVAAGFAPIALGTESDGSTVGQAGVCGVVGVQPEFGLVSSHGGGHVSPAGYPVGLFASRVRDAAMCLAALAERPDLTSVAEPMERCRVGLWRYAAGPRRDVAALLISVAEALADGGVEVVDIEPAVPDEIAGLSVLDDVLRDNDIRVIVAPANEPALPIDYRTGVAGLPSSLPAVAGRADISLPAGLVDGLPVGMSVFGPATVAELLGVAVLIERSLGPRPWPDLV
ncbi:MAG TPA: amidase family protein [Pseudonocardiaceae bacterium]|nr:amidase family protein [Pseudonocardiaceae bacterium]